MVSRALKKATPSLREVAEAIGDVSYHAVRSWSIGRDTPRPENLSKLADWMDSQADTLRGLASELREKGEE